MIDLTLFQVSSTIQTTFDPAVEDRPLSFTHGGLPGPVGAAAAGREGARGRERALLPQRTARAAGEAPVGAVRSTRARGTSQG